MSEIIPKLPEDIAEKFLELKNKIVTITENYNEKDGRFVILNNCNLAIISIITKLNTWLALRNDPTLQIIYRRMIGLDEGDLEGFMRQEIFFVRLSFVAIFQFQIETLFKILIAKLENKQPPEKYYQIIKRLLKLLKLESQEKEDILNLLAYVRNSFHSNGVHTRKSKTFTINGQKFEFVEGQPLSRGDYGDLYFILNEVIKIIDEIFSTEKIKTISSIPFQHGLDFG
ncbi:MAG: hypothetical protein ACYC6W_06390 [Nitrosotalea sp.]